MAIDGRRDFRFSDRLRKRGESDAVPCGPTRTGVALTFSARRLKQSSIPPVGHRELDCGGAGGWIRGDVRLRRHGLITGTRRAGDAACEGNQPRSVRVSLCVRGGRIGQHNFRIARRPFFAKGSQPGSQGWRRVCRLAIKTSPSATCPGNLPGGVLIHALDRSWATYPKPDKHLDGRSRLCPAKRGSRECGSKLVTLRYEGRLAKYGSAPARQITFTARTSERRRVVQFSPGSGLRRLQTLYRAI